MKKCAHCNEVKDLSEFSRNASNPDGHDYRCTPCKREYHRLLRLRLKSTGPTKTSKATTESEFGPCDDCEHYDTCAKYKFACKVYKNWYNTGVVSNALRVPNARDYAIVFWGSK